MKCDVRQAGAVSEGFSSDTGDAIRNRDTSQAGAGVEGTVSDAIDAIRNRDTGQAAAAIEGKIPDAGDGIWDDVIGTCLAFRIGMQERHLLVEQNSIKARIIHVSRANLNSRQGATPIEGCISDTGNAIRNGDARQTGAVSEGS